MATTHPPVSPHPSAAIGDKLLAAALADGRAPVPVAASAGTAVPVATNDADLARALAAVQLNDSIPVEVFLALTEILSYIHQSRDRWVIPVKP